MAFRLPTKEEKAHFVHEQFERIARGYDLTNDVISFGLHRNWKRRAVALLECRPSGSYLDVCCGTGDLALAIASSGAGSVTGVDFSPNMLALAHERGKRAYNKKAISCLLEWKQADAQELPFSAATFDGAVVGFGLRNLVDLEKGLSEMVRVVRAGGKVVNLDLGQPSKPVFAPLFKIYFCYIVPLLGQLLQNDCKAYTYLPESLAAYPKPSEMSSIFSRAGLIQVRCLELSGGAVALHVGTVV